MKAMPIAILIIAFILGFLASGCKVVTLQPKLGEYHYIRRMGHSGVAFRVIPIWVDKNFGEADRLSIEDAIDAWNYALNGYYLLKVVDNNFDMEVDKIVQQVNQNGWLFMKVTSDNKLVPTNDKGYWTIGFVERIGGHHLYLVRDRLGNDDIFGVTLHEIGHLMGSSHVGERLMYPHYSRARFQCIDYVTLKKVAEYQTLPFEGLNYCVDTNPNKAEKPKGGGPMLTNCPMDEEHKIFNERLWESF